jgi:hypothetical protein
VRGAEADDLHVDEAYLEAGGADVGFGDGLLAFRVDEPQSSGAVDLFGDCRKLAQVSFFVSGEKNPGRIVDDFVFGEMGSVCFEVGQEIGRKGAYERNGLGGFYAEFLEDGFGVGDFLAPLGGGFGTKFENRQAVFGMDVEFAVDGVEVGDGVEWDFEASVTAEEEFGSFEEGFAGEGSSCVPECARKFVTHGGIKVTQVVWEGKSFV